MAVAVEGVRRGALTQVHHHLKRRFRMSRAGGFGSLTGFVMLILLGFILFNYFHLTFHGLLEGFLHFFGT